MIKEHIYVAINKDDKIQFVRGLRYFQVVEDLEKLVEAHNYHHEDDIWKIRRCVILEDFPCEENVGDYADADTMMPAT